MAVNTVEIIYADAGALQDIVVGTTGGNVFAHLNQGNNTIARTTIVNFTSTSILDVYGGDLDDELWDDVVCSTSNGWIYYVRHNHGNSWDTNLVDIIEDVAGYEAGRAQINAIGVGDVARGVVVSAT